jgi:hypothetical protein
LRTSTDIGELAAALAKAQGEMAGAKKDSENPFFSSHYAALDSVWDACREPLSKNGLSVIQFPKAKFIGTPEPYEWTARSGEKRHGVRVVCRVSVLTRLAHSSGQWVEDTMSTLLSTGDPQSVGSATTYLRRYALQAVAGIAPEDDDGEGAHGSEHARQTKRAPAGEPQTKGEPSKLDQLRIDIVKAADELAQREGGGFGKDLIEKYSAFGSGKDRKAITDVDKASEAWLLRALDKIREQLLKTEPGREAGELFTETKK